MADFHNQCVEFFKTLQDSICKGLSDLDGKPFHEDRWEMESGGGGRTRVLVDGNVFEKAGVNFSDVRGEFPADFSGTMPGSGRAFRASGVSLVLHPWNPRVPTVHANFRHIERGDAGWFGGGADLTPYYPYRDDCIHFHQVWKNACDRHSAVADYAKFKEECDRYFHLPHRKEARGIGGIFFDYLTAEPEKTFDFIRDASTQFLESYLPIARRRMTEKYEPQEREFQLFRRGRYVEFNLVYDRGTLFGLKTGGRIESILMSLPLNVKWLYDYKPAPGSREEEIYKCLVPQDWVNGPDVGF